MMDTPDTHCSECGSSMAKVRTEISPIGVLHRFECVNCDALGTVEARPESSIAAEAPKTDFHGSATCGDEL